MSAAASLPTMLTATAAALSAAPASGAPIKDIADDLTTTASLLHRFLSSSALGIFAALGMLVALVATRVLVRDAVRVRKLNTPTGFVLVYLAVASGDVILPGTGWLTFIAQVFLVLSLISTASFYFFDLLLPRWRQREVPAIIRDLVQAVLFIITMVVLLAGTGVNISGLLVGSTVVTAVIGLALQDTLSNVISGLSIQIEKPFQEGDWVTFGDLSGQVQAISWRTTKILTSHADLVILPNKIVANGSLVNHSRPEPRHRRKLEIGAPYAVPPNRVARALLEAAASVPGVLASPAPDVLLRKYGDFTVDYELRFFIDDFGKRWELDDAVLRRIWYHFARAGIDFPFPVRDVTMRQVTPAETAARRAAETAARVRLLRSIDFLAPLTDDDLARLAEHIDGKDFSAGETIIHQGDEGDSMYLVRSGQVDIQVAAGAGQRTVATIGEKNFFGEMSLMTGAPRTATVVAKEDVAVYVIDKADFQDVLTQSPKLAEQISEVLARRQMSLQTSAAAVAPAEIKEKSRDVLDKIRRFFRF
ncbi:MAG TPA: mechanosensitive ion channel family protein [Myxococcota bacterium]|jgi:small-conductance mechanosensitive channel/CRP-like cAMP-binding protein|nr:mechanosensitive ion channel family protein [Myxococcota bacterium]